MWDAADELQLEVDACEEADVERIPGLLGGFLLVQAACNRTRGGALGGPSFAGYPKIDTNTLYASAANLFLL